jgi:hypothetical protein
VLAAVFCFCVVFFFFDFRCVRMFASMSQNLCEWQWIVGNVCMSFYVDLVKCLHLHAHFILFYFMLVLALF